MFKGIRFNAALLCMFYLTHLENVIIYTSDLVQQDSVFPAESAKAQIRRTRTLKTRARNTDERDPGPTGEEITLFSLSPSDRLTLTVGREEKQIKGGVKADDRRKEEKICQQKYE